MDRRLTPANGRVAALRLKEVVEAERFVEGEPRQIGVPVTNLWSDPAGTRERQLLWGERVTVYEEGGGFAFVEAVRDGYVGYLDAASLVAPIEATHIVSVPATHLYPGPDLKRPEITGLSFGSRLRVVSASGDFFELHDGAFVPKRHLRPANKPFTDPATVAQLFFGVPYLWGGNSVWGLDCSGLIQAALLATGHPCPGDSDLQEKLGSEIADDAPIKRCDLIFWKGHVAMAVDEETLIHANAHTMSVAYETIVGAIKRIAPLEGPVTGRRRLDFR